MIRLPATAASQIWLHGQHGVVLVAVAIVLVVVGAAIALAGDRVSGLVSATDGEFRFDQARYLAEAGLAHARWQLAGNSSCAGYADVPTTALGDGTYAAGIAPTSGSPVRVNATGQVATTSASLERTDLRVYGPPQTTSVFITLGGQDTYIRDGLSVLSNFEGNEPLLLEADGAAQSRVLLQFDVSGLPQGVLARSAELQLTQTVAGAADARAEVFRMTRAWDADGASWLSPRTSLLWDAPGGDFDPIVLADFSLATATTHALDVTGLVNGWLDGSTENFGLIVTGAADGSADAGSFDGSAGGIVPRLVLSYVCECGATCLAAALPDPIGYWAMDDLVGTTATDSAADNDGTLSGASWAVAGRISAALEFDGSDEVTVPDDELLDLTERFSLSGWFYRARTASDGARTILSKASGSGGDNYWLGLVDDRLAGGVGTTTFLTDALAIESERWHMATLTFDNVADRVRLYLDGVEAGSFSTTAENVANTAPLRFGNNPDGEYWLGRLDDVRLYDVAFTAVQVDALHADSVALGGAVTSGCAGEHRDNFAAIAYDGSAGSFDWSPHPWVESGEADGPGSGDIAVVTDLLVRDLRIRGDGTGNLALTRRVDLSGAGTASLAYNYLRSSLENSADYVAVEVSATGDAGDWTEVARHDGPASDLLFFANTVDISDYASRNTHIRLQTSAALAGGDSVRFDNVAVTCAP